MQRMSVSEKINMGQMVSHAIAVNNTIFTNPGQVLTDLGNATNALLAAWTNAQDGGKSLVALMHDKEKEFDEAMTRVAHYVEAVANGDESIVHLSTLNVRPVKTSSPSDFKVEVGKEAGQARLRVKAQEGAGAYIWQYSTDPNNAGSWIEAQMSTRSSANISGLSQGVKYWFRFSYVDKAGKHAFSEPVSAIVV